MMASETTSKSPFLSLPNELILSIVERIDQENIQDLLNLSLTSRRMCMLSLDHLYGHLTVRSPWPLLRTIFLSPELASRVHKVTWRYNMKEKHDTAANKPTLFNSLDELRIPKISGAACCDMQRSQTWLFHEFMETFLMFTPNLHKLIIKDTHAWMGSVYLFKMMAANPDRLVHLKSVHIHASLLSMEQLAHLFLLPSLRKVTATDLVLLDRPEGDPLEWNSDMPLQTVLDPGSSAVENITLKRSCVGISTLGCFTAACRNLKSFAYEHEYYNDHRMRQYKLPSSSRFSTLASPLTHTLTTLEHLSIRGDARKLDQTHVLQVARLASGMKYLRSLDMGLLSHDDNPDQCTEDFVTHLVRFLPSTLEEMTFEIDWQDSWGSKGWVGPTEMLCYIAALAPSKLNLLKRVAVVDWPPFLGHFPPDFAKLHRCFAEQNIHFSSIPAQLEGRHPLQWSDYVEPGWVFVEVAEA
ncbi:hypothetical protein Alg215_11631 [Pyrenophora tritici-repentis]|nr:hypothetical protein Alg215_11631 [Pyrenophora tritici-repentis]